MHPVRTRRSTFKEPSHRLLSPLDIPEVLERIFSFMDEDTLASSVALVCSHWHNLSKRFINTTVDIDVSANASIRNILTAAIPKATRLLLGASLNPDDSNENYDNQKLKSMLLEKTRPPLDPTRPSASVPLRELVLWREFSDMPSLMSLFPSLTHLTQLKLHSDFGHTRLDLGAILHAYPNLVSLDISAVQEACYLIVDPGSGYFANDTISSPEIPSPLRLVNIRLRGVTISQMTLQNLLSACSVTLKDLHIWDFRSRIRGVFYEASSRTHPVEQGNLFDLEEFIDFLYGLSLSLETFSMSASEEFSAINMARTLWHRDILDTFGTTVQQWGFPISFVRYLDPVHPITFLELEGQQRDLLSTPKSLAQQYALHYFLCQAPHLLHLKARSVLFSAEHLDLDSPHKRDQLQGNTLWACSKLQTLSLTFVDPQLSLQLRGRASRIVFGYLARMTPRLKNLELGYIFQTDVRLADGWVLLSRLQFLERITVWPTQILGRKKAMDRLWAVVRPGGLDQTIQNWYTMRTWKKQLTVEMQGFQGIQSRIILPEGYRESSLRPWTSTEYLGTLCDVKMALEDVLRDPEMEAWWSKLCSVRIQSQWANVHGFDQRTIESRQPFRYTDRTRVMNVPLS